MGFVRIWLIRGVILSVLASLIAAAWIMHGWVSPERVREAVLLAVQEKFPDCQVSVGSARLRIFGGICVSELQITRRGADTPFLRIPEAILHHDKEQLQRGRLSIRKVELHGVVLEASPQGEGGWTLADLLKSGDSQQPIPTILAHDSIILLRKHPFAGLPPLYVRLQRISLINDPLHTLKLDANIHVSAATPDSTAPAPSLPARLAVRWHRPTGTVQLRIESDDLTVTPDLAPAAERLDPRLGEILSRLTAIVDVKIELTLPNGALAGLRYDARFDLRDGRFEDAMLPWPMSHVAATVRLQDGVLTVDDGTAKLGEAATRFTLASRAPADTHDTPLIGGPKLYRPRLLPISYIRADESVEQTHEENLIHDLESQLERMEIAIRDLSLTDELFQRLPPPADALKRMFHPTGGLDLELRFVRTGSGWTRELTARPNRLGVVYEKFRYPVNEVAGWVKRVTSSDGTDEFRVQLTGTAGGRRVEASGRVGTDGPDPLVELTVAGTDVPIDERLFAALPPRYAASLGKLRASGRGDFIAELRQRPGVNRLENTIRVRVYDGSVNYAHFPYALGKVAGQMHIRVTASDPTRPLKIGMAPGTAVDTQRVQLREFEARHGAGKVWLSGDVEQIAGTHDRRISLRVQGDQLPADEELRQALAALKADNIWDTFSPRGHFTFGSDLEIIDRNADDNDGDTEAITETTPPDPPFDPTTDLTVTLNFKGPTVTPKFFPYDIQELAGLVRFQGGELDLAQFTGKHGDSQMALEAAKVRFAPDGEIWANIGGINVRPLIPDAAFRAAFPAKMRAGLEMLNPRGPMTLRVKHLVVKVPGESNLPVAPAPAGAPIVRGQMPAIEPILFWNAELSLGGAAIDAGLHWHDLHGTMASVGRYEGNRLGAVLGNAWIDRALCAGQPLSGVKATFRIRPQQPDPVNPGGYTPVAIEFPDLTGLFHQGTIGGEARVVLDDVIRYRVWLTAAGVRLDELTRELKLDSGVELRGLAQGRLLVENVPDPQTGEIMLTGSGQVDVPNGRMYNLPLMLPLLKLLKLQAPDQTAFEEAHASFELRGSRINVTQLDLIGTALSLGGSGELDTASEDLHFEFYTVWSQALKRWLSTPLGDVTSFLSGNLFKIELVRRNGETTYTPQMLPVVTEPMKAVAERLRTRLGGWELPRGIQPAAARAIAPK